LVTDASAAAGALPPGYAPNPERAGVNPYGANPYAANPYAGAPPPTPAATPGARGATPAALDEHPLKVTMMLTVVKLLPKK